MMPSLEQLVIIARCGKIAHEVRMLDLDALRRDLAFSERAMAKLPPTNPALLKLTEIRIREQKLILFFAEQLRELSPPVEELQTLTREAEGAVGAMRI